ncbi:MAG: glycosyltransferase family 2 protein, partial [Candidatus Omnitrophica bacterium]|nr:glycosyltransferase family 2 protein [Candidatus Omnitrophota bacterium]
GADIIVNTDGDNQYRGKDIPGIIKPILEKEAEIVIGDRRVRTMKQFSPLKRQLQILGNFVVRRASGTPVYDATSGFRAISREAALKLNLKAKFSHTIETILFAARENITLTTIPIETNLTLRPSRLAPNMWSFIIHSIAPIIQTYFFRRHNA